jgi:O-antigen/teichoic acid export membrane protein
MALQPVVSRLWDEGRRDEVSLFLSQSFKYSIVFGLPAVVGLSALAPRLLGLLSTNAFVAASYAIVPLAAAGILLDGIAGVFASVMRLHKNTRAIAVAVTLAAALHLTLNFILIPAFGIVGGAIATFIGYGLELGFTVFQSWRHTRFPLPLRALVASIVASALMLPVVVWIGAWEGWLGLILAIGAGAAVYGTTLLLLGGVTWNEVRVVLRGSAA